MVHFFCFLITITLFPIFSFNKERTKQLTLSRFMTVLSSLLGSLETTPMLDSISAARILGNLCFYRGNELKSFGIVPVTIYTIGLEKLSQLCIAHFLQQSGVLPCCRFGGKEEYMGFMNGFVEKEFVNMRKFLEEISVS